MQAQQIMTRNFVAATETETVGMALEKMKERRLHMLPVLKEDGTVLGVVTMFSILARVVPNYILTGDLESVPYAPDIGLMRRRYDQLVGEPITAATDTEPLLVKPDESLLSVAAALLPQGRHEHALVTDARKALLGVISAGDILAGLKASPGEAPGA
jgi:CBS domain-containing protein